MLAHGLTPILNVSNILDSFSWFEKLGVDSIYQECLANGIEVTMLPTDKPWNVREMHIRHPDGHVFRISKGVDED